MYRMYNSLSSQLQPVKTHKLPKARASEQNRLETHQNHLVAKIPE